MSETSSDAESSCGWTIISNEGSDIETLGSEAVVEFGAEVLDPPTLEEPELLESQASASAALSVEEKAADSLEDTLGEQTLDETLCAPKAADCAAGKEHVLSLSDHSDIVTLGDLKEGEHVQEEATASEELYLGTSCSSHYAFTATDTGLLLSHWKLPQTLVNLSYHLRSQLTGSRTFPAFPAPQPAVTNSSSSEDEAGRSAGAVVRRRRVRKNTTSIVTDPEEEESRSSDEEEKVREVEQEEERTEVGPTAALDDRGRGGRMLNKCILLALIIAISMGFGHFYGTVQIQERQKTGEKIRGNELDVVRDLLHVRKQGFTNQRIYFGQDGLDEKETIALLAEVIEKIKQENKELNVKRVHIQAQRDDLKMLLKQTAEERTNIMSQQQSLTAENQLLKNSLEHEEKSLSILQEELRKMRSQIRDLEAVGAGADSLLSENQRLRDRLEEEKQVIRDFHVQREDMVGEAQMLRKKLDKERRVTEELRRELNRLRSRIPEAGKEGVSEAEELQSRLTELEKRLGFEQQRSDLWERLYLENKDERAKGDRESKVKKTKGSMAGKVEETFDAVKNSTKEFVSHHKEQIKKAKEAVKENLRKFSDSVKSTFRHFKDSASTFITKARGFYHKKKTEESWQHRQHGPRHRHKSDFFQSDHNTRKSGGKVHEDHTHSGHRTSMKGCAGVFDCAFQESMSLFNIALEPIRADEFYQLLQSYLQQEVDHFHHWKELEMFINNFFHNGVFIHDQMLFTDFVSGVEDYLTDMHEYHGPADDVFGDLDDYIYRHFFGEAYTKSYGPRGPFERPDAGSKEEFRAKHQQRKQQRARSRPHNDRKWSRSGRDADRHMADVKIELGPMPFDPKY
ncbi:cell cycle progression protein 1 isoform 1-T1 [Odontesthes bonariensis]|uniref:cell cycle progression protein 1 isoform X2 n=1 Tax=Odontesthes bonariensis TaxID=219752 RepID=UPI003F587D4F